MQHVTTYCSSKRRGNVIRTCFVRFCPSLWVESIRNKSTWICKGHKEKSENSFLIEYACQQLDNMKAVVTWPKSPGLKVKGDLRSESCHSWRTALPEGQPLLRSEAYTWAEAGLRWLRNWKSNVAWRFESKGSFEGLSSLQELTFETVLEGERYADQEPRFVGICITPTLWKLRPKRPDTTYHMTFMRPPRKHETPHWILRHES